MATDWPSPKEIVYLYSQEIRALIFKLNQLMGVRQLCHDINNDAGFSTYLNIVISYLKGR